MVHYVWYQWFAFFFIYSFIGWIWETGYVSVRTKHFVNRGFLYGPQIPIYGSGAVLLVLFLRPISNYPLLTYFAGVAVGSLLEIITGWAMEKIFHVRYWDYSDQPYNFKGYICLTASLFWGFLGYLLINFIHKPFEKLILEVNQTFLLIAVIIISLGFITDFVFSFISAYGMRKVVDSLAKAKEELEKAKEVAEHNIKLAQERAKEIAEQNIKLAQEKAKERYDAMRDESSVKVKEQIETVQEKLKRLSEEYAKRKETYTGRRARLLKRHPSAKLPKSIRQRLKLDKEEK